MYMKVKIKPALGLILLCLTQQSIADLPEQEQKRFLQTGQQQWLRQLENMSLQQPEKEAKPMQVLTQQDLRRQPQLLAAMLVQVLNSHPQPELLEDLTALYTQVSQPDPVLLRRAQGMVAKYRGDYVRATEIYRQLAAEQPDDMRIKLDLAAMLSEDKQWRESALLFDAVRQNPELPEVVKQNVDKYLDDIFKQQQWNWSGGLSPAFEDNVNNAPPPHCSPLGCSRERTESASGLAYGLGLAKNRALSGHHNLRIQLDVSGTSYYWSNKSSYDSAYGRLGGGWLWQGARQRLLVLPFYQFQLSGTDNWGGKKPQNNHTFKLHMWAHAPGVRVEYSRLLSPRWQAYLALDAYRQRYRLAEQAKRSDGWYWGENLSMAWRASPRNTLYAGLSANQMLPERSTLNGIPNNSAYRRYGMNAGWIHDWEWLGGVSTRLNASVAARRFRGTALNITPHGFFPGRRRDREVEYSVAVWHRNWLVWGMTPKLNFSWQRIRSSHVWAERDNKQVFLELEKQF